ncbi:MAG: hypothetical protein KDK36_11125, partial [Leptospiraceae bacterium]|nr:hypothetical protein [Leptospiraceae bacterium]
MQFLKVQGYRFYILITYIVIVILFGIEEMINYRTNLDCSKEYRFIFMGIEFLEALIGVISIFGILFLI